MGTQGLILPPTPGLLAPSESLSPSLTLLKLEHVDSSVVLAVLRSQALSVGVNLHKESPTLKQRSVEAYDSFAHTRTLSH